MGVSWPEFGVLVLLAEFPGGCLCFVVVDGADLIWLRFAGFGGVVLFAARGPVGRALDGSSFAIGPLVD